jgi:hypothetical protein
MLLLRIPNVLRVDAAAYDPDAFDGGLEEVADPRTGVRRLRPNDINVLRWRAA